MICTDPICIEKKCLYQNIEILPLHIVTENVHVSLLMMVNAGGSINSF